MAKLDSPTEAQQKWIREKLATGRLPRTLAAVSPVPSAVDIPIMTGRLRVAPCDACDQVDQVRPIGGLLWHDACFRFGQAEAART
jgi:hypothetical protein